MKIHLQGRLRALQAGSFVVLFTRCADQLLIEESFKLIYWWAEIFCRLSSMNGRGVYFRVNTACLLTISCVLVRISKDESYTSPSEIWPIPKVMF